MTSRVFVTKMLQINPFNYFSKWGFFKHFCAANCSKAIKIHKPVCGKCLIHRDISVDHRCSQQYSHLSPSPQNVGVSNV